MMNVIKSEIRKILTVRVSYVIMAINVFLAGTISVANLMQLRATDALDASAIELTLLASVSLAGQLAAVYVIILMAHEYRYNLIFHTLTGTNSRSRVLVAKILTALLYSWVLTLVVVAVGYLVSSITLNGIVDQALQQHINWTGLAIDSLVYVSAFTLIGLLLTIFFRSIVMPIVMIILVPSTIEPLLGLLLDDNQKYLPFTSIQELIYPGVEADLLRSVITISVYLIVGWAIGWYLFLRRDATQQ